MKNPFPHPDYSKLNYEQENWVLYQQKKGVSHYDKARVIIDTGLFFLLELRKNNQFKLLVIFSDQLDKNTKRLVNIISKI